MRKKFYFKRNYITRMSMVAVIAISAIVGVTLFQESHAAVANLSGITFYTKPGTSAALAYEEAKRTNSPDTYQLSKIGTWPLAVWFGDWNTNIQADTNALVTAATASNKTAVIVTYNIPQRDCGQYSAGGANSQTAYNQWIDGVANGIGGRTTIVILEPDAIGLMNCLSATDKQLRYDMLNRAVQVLTAKGAIVYIEASTWVSPADMAVHLIKSGIAGAQGFAINTSGFNWTSDMSTYGKQLSGLIGDKHFIIDTSRNGNGPWQSADPEPWCNPPDRALGSTPTTNTGIALVDAFVWLKTPGESDGTCHGGPGAGTWWRDYAIGLAQRSNVLPNTSSSTTTSPAPAPTPTPIPAPAPALPPNSLPTGAYTIIGIGNKCMDVAGQSSVNGAQVQMWTCAGSPNQGFDITAAQEIRPKYTANKCIDVNAGATIDGTKIQLWDCNGTNAQKWTYVEATRELKNPSGQCLDVASGSTTDGALVQLYTCNGTVAQKWTLQPLGTTTPTPVPSPSTTVPGPGIYNDSVFSYVGTWSVGDNVGANKYLGDDHYTNITGSSYQLTFTGQSIKIYGAKAQSHGVMAVSIDNGAETIVDTYAATRADQALLYSSPSLSSGTHTVKVRVTGTKQAAATNTSVAADRIDVLTTAPQVGNGDVNGEGRVNALDLSLLLSHDGQNYPSADFDRNGSVGAADLAIMLSNWTW